MGWIRSPGGVRYRAPYGANELTQKYNLYGVEGRRIREYDSCIRSRIYIYYVYRTCKMWPLYPRLWALYREQMDVTLISEAMSLISGVDEAQLAQLPTAFRLLPTSWPESTPGLDVRCILKNKVISESIKEHLLSSANRSVHLEVGRKRISPKVNIYQVISI